MEMRRRFLNQKTMRRSLSDLEFEEVQGFKDLGFSFEKETLSPSLASILPGLQEKKRDETEEDKATRRPYLSKAWLVQSCAPPIPNWTSHKYDNNSNSSYFPTKIHIKQILVYIFFSLSLLDLVLFWKFCFQTNYRILYQTNLQNPTKTPTMSTIAKRDLKSFKHT